MENVADLKLKKISLSNAIKYCPQYVITDLTFSACLSNAKHISFTSVYEEILEKNRPIVNLNTSHQLIYMSHELFEYESSKKIGNECPSGYYGKGCSLRNCDINNGGCGESKCVSVLYDNSFLSICICEGKYKSRYLTSDCEQIPNECYFEPCELGQDCIKKDNSFECKCFYPNYPTFLKVSSLTPCPLPPMMLLLGCAPLSLLIQKDFDLEGSIADCIEFCSLNLIVIIKELSSNFKVSDKKGCLCSNDQLSLTNLDKCRTDSKSNFGVFSTFLCGHKMIEPCSIECVGSSCMCPEDWLSELCISSNCNIKDPCIERELCVIYKNFYGSYRECQCPPGFYKRSMFGNCLDINECSLKLNICDQKTTFCINVPGSFFCNCKKGFVSANKTHCMKNANEFNKMKIKILFNQIEDTSCNLVLLTDSNLTTNCKFDEPGSEFIFIVYFHKYVINVLIKLHVKQGKFPISFEIYAKLEGKRFRCFMDFNFFSAVCIFYTNHIFINIRKRIIDSFILYEIQGKFSDVNILKSSTSNDDFNRSHDNTITSTNQTIKMEFYKIGSGKLISISLTILFTLVILALLIKFILMVKTAYSSTFGTDERFDMLSAHLQILEVLSQLPKSNDD